MPSPSKKAKIYWDACAFLGFLKGEPNKAACVEIIKAAKAKHIQIWTSSIVLVEVLHLGRKEGKVIPASDRDQIRRLFSEPYVQIVTADWWICTQAQELFWAYPDLKWKDSIHVATAIRHKIPLVHSYDPDFLDINGVVGDPPLRIEEPNISSGPLFEGIEWRTA